MRLAVLADIHANLTALEAVLADVEGQKPDRLVVLGDLVGYHAEPSECLALVRARADWVVAGNHDRDVCNATVSAGTTPTARNIQEWTRSRLTAEELAYLAALPNRVLDDAGVVGVHGCYLNDTHVNGYVTGTMLEDNLRAVLARTGWPSIALCGHTHQPMCGWLTPQGAEERRPVDVSVSWPREAPVALINPGSVGQPRDGDPRASWALLDLATRTASFRRVDYDISRTARSLVAAGLDGALADRLHTGR